MTKDYGFSNIKTNVDTWTVPSSMMSASISTTKFEQSNHVKLLNYIDGLNEEEYGRLIEFLDSKIKFK